MTIDVRCKCGKLFRVKDDLAGKRGKCSTCGMSLRIPLLSPAPQDAISSTSAAQRCPECQASLPANSLICIECGLDLRTRNTLAPLEFNPVVVPSNPKQSLVRPRRQRKPFVFIVAGCSLALMVIAGVFYVEDRSHREVAKPKPRDLPTDVAARPASHPVSVTPPRPQVTVVPQTAPAAVGKIQFIDAKFVDSIEVEQTVDRSQKISQIVCAREGNRLLWTRFRFRPDETATIFGQTEMFLDLSWMNAKSDETNRSDSPACLDATLKLVEGAPAHASLIVNYSGLAEQDFIMPRTEFIIETTAIKVNLSWSRVTVERGIGDVFVSCFFVVPETARNFTIGELEGRSFNVAMGNAPLPEMVLSTPPAGPEKPAAKDPLAVARSRPREPRPDRIIRQARALPDAALDRWEQAFQTVGYSMSRADGFLFLTDFTRLYDSETFLEADSIKFIQRLALVPKDHIATWEAALRRSISQRLVPPLPDDIGTLIVIVQQESLFPAGGFDPALSQMLAERIETIPASAIEEMRAAAGQNSATEETDAAVAIAHYDPLFVETRFQENVWQGLPGRTAVTPEP